MSEIEWEEVPNATWADVQPGYKYDYAYIGPDNEWRVVDRVISKPDVIPGGPTSVLLRAWKPVEKPKPTVAFVEHWVKRPAFLHEDHYYDARSGEFLASVNSGKVDVICEGIVVPAAELKVLLSRWSFGGTPLVDAAEAFVKRCEELGVLDE